MQCVGLVGGSGQDDELAVWRIAAPALQLLEPVAPVPTAAEQTHHDQPCRLGCGIEVVVQLSWVFETTQGQRADPLVPGWGEWKAGVEIGENQERLHAHIWLTVHHYSQVQVNMPVMQRMFKQAYNSHIGAENLRVLRCNKMPYIQVKLLPTSDWAMVMKQYIHKGMQFSQ